MTYAKGDGYIRDGGGNLNKEDKWNEHITIFTSSKNMVRDLAEIMVKAGYQYTYKYVRTEGKEQRFRNGKYVIKTNQHIFRIKRSKWTYVQNLKIQKKWYEGWVYDVELDKNHVLLVMRNGKIVWSGNCRCSIGRVYEKNKRWWE